MKTSRLLSIFALALCLFASQLSDAQTVVVRSRYPHRRVILAPRRPVVLVPAPVVVRPRRVYVAPRRVYVAPQPVVVVRQPVVVRRPVRRRYY